jgi:hypothetical protein
MVSLRKPGGSIISEEFFAIIVTFDVNVPGTTPLVKHHPYLAVEQDLVDL